MTVQVPAKINLSLSVGRRQADGYHALRTVFQAVSLHDRVTATVADELRVTVRASRLPDREIVGVPVDATNLAARAAAALAEGTGCRPDVRLDIVKAIPVAGGMAGGSADAAGALVACDALWATGLDRAALAAVGARVGSDVPFCLYGGTALGTGRGERVTPTLTRGRYHWVLALAEDGLSTALVYAELDRQRADTARRTVRVEPDASGVLSALRSGDAVALGRALTNDLQPAAIRLRPSLQRTLEAGRDLGALGGLVSGSGPTCVFLAASAPAADELAASLAGAGVCRTVRRVDGPVPGARVLPEGVG